MPANGRWDLIRRLKGSYYAIDNYTEVVEDHPTDIYT